MKYRWRACVAVWFFGATFGFAEPPTGGTPIVGLWQVVGANAKCVETWNFRADGTSHNFSGSEESFSEYQLSAFSSEKGYYVLTDTITRTNGQPDCTGRPTPVGDRATIFLVPLSNDEFKICLDTMVRLCVGTMTRTTRPTA
ncbi:MAG TPA: hypothetical protein VK700_00795 [Steroidobacteraceae bacterium]|jgi:hypothetical protein|nr:hypothetical protein [Steroidobacteraceae bacterium]